MPPKKTILLVLGTVLTMFGIFQVLQAFGVIGVKGMNPQSRILFSLAFALIGLCGGVTCFRYALASDKKKPTDVHDLAE